MLDDLWRKFVTNPGGLAGRSELVMDIAAAMATRESLWVPTVLFEERQSLIDYLIGVGILTRAKSGAGISFSHQTLFEHAWARAFAREKCSLAEYAIARQHGLFICSTVWAGLNYLRGADLANYRREFAQLWNRTDLRRHLRHLLLDFLGTIRDPDLQEQSWFFATLSDPELKEKAVAAIRGNPGWFPIVAGSHLPQLMRQEPKDLGPVTALLISALPFAKARCIELLRAIWLPDREKDVLPRKNRAARWGDP